MFIELIFFSRKADFCRQNIVVPEDSFYNKFLRLQKSSCLAILAQFAPWDYVGAKFLPSHCLIYCFQMALLWEDEAI
jgi:hypothetical protein